MRWIRARALGLLALAGCGGEKLDVGSNDAGATGPVIDGIPQSGSPVAGVWSGPIDGFSLPSGSNLVTLTVVLGHNETLTATLVFGVLPPPPPATDPNVGYPPGADFALDASSAPGASFDRLYEGFPYTAELVSYDGTTLHLGVMLSEIWKTWCALQTAFGPTYASNLDAGVYGCLPTDVSVEYIPPDKCALVTDDGGVTPLDCGKSWLCSIGPQICTCSASGCESTGGAPDDLFTLQLGQGSLDGTFTGSGIATGDAVHLVRVP
jgi:hypothetical protein